MKFGVRLHAVLIIAVASLLVFGSGEIFSTLSQCCNQGSAAAELNQSCDGSWVSGSLAMPVLRRVERHLQAVCKSSLAICCLRTYRRRMCSVGIQAARLSPNCIAPSGIGAEYFQDCCDACKLGVAVRSKGNELSCQSESSFDFGSPWHEAFRQCCITGLNVTGDHLQFAENHTVATSAKQNIVVGGGFSPVYDPVRPSPLPYNPNPLPSNAVDDVVTAAHAETCDRIPSDQLCDHVCVDGPQGYFCRCRPGYRLQADGKSCRLGSGRCSSNNPCDQLCEDTGDAIVCSCRPGYELMENGHSCQDVNECEEGSHDCRTITERCINTIGGYRCASSWRRSDPTTSASSPSLADLTTRPPSDIENSDGDGDGSLGLYPICPPGYEYSSHLDSCQDTDECALGMDGCDHATHLCLNTIGSFVCVKKEPLVPCPPGHRYDEAGNLCVDIDECAEKLDACNRQREYCLNLLGTYECHPRSGTSCPAGYKYNGVLQTCEDVDECAESLHNCDGESETCRNVAGAYECDVKCEPGFRYDLASRSCEDADECREGLHDCDLKRHEVCVNTHGAYECTLNPSAECKAGYKPEAGGCVDVDECLEELDACDRETEVCVNDVGLYRCDPLDVAMPAVSTVSCSEGYRRDAANPKICIDVDECKEGLHDCHPLSSLCINVIGSFTCKLKQCRRGYRLSLTTGSCQDIDECAEGLTDGRCSDATCMNTEGGYECRRTSSVKPSIECPAGHRFDLSTRSCKDIDECDLHLDTCNRSSEICFNTAGGYRCWQVQCPVGYRPNMLARTCEDVDECAQGLHNCTSSEICVNQRGRFSCMPLPSACPPGHRRSFDACLDIDECAENQNGCDSLGEECVNTIGGYECVARRQPCSPGFRMDVTSRSCADVNECTENVHDCDPHTSECRNTYGGFVCQRRHTSRSAHGPARCAAGFQQSEDDSRCVDVDECLEETSSCDRHRELCVNSVGSYTCLVKQRPSCPSGYAMNSHRRVCEDVDECADGTHDCRTDVERCLNEQGRFRCIVVNVSRERSPLDTSEPTLSSSSSNKSFAWTCSTGFEYSEMSGTCVDVNECQVGAHSCLATQRCDNTVGSFTCIRLTGCGTGYTLNAHTSHCEDDDECALGFHNCGPAYECRNTLGSFRCERKTCPAGTRLVADGSCISVACGVGLEPGSEGQCADVNECESDDNPCRRNQRCINTIGSYQCHDLINCGSGYQMDDLGTRCVDIDECATNVHDCQGNQQCVNRGGGYICQCPTGHTLNARNECEDVDECARYLGRACGNNAMCRNTIGSYVCDCNDGFKHGENNRTCTDVDECQLFADVCQHGCVNVWGSYLCTCQPGYTQGPDKRTCIDVDECSLYKDRGNLCVGICINEPGSFSCSCPEGYALSADKRTCQDVDECQQGSVCRGPDVSCLNTRGSYRCNTLVCPPEYIRDTNHKNRCKRESTVCRQDDEECIKKPLSYSFNYLTFVSNLPIPPAGHVNLFTMRGPPFSDLSSEFSLELKDARAPPLVVRPATRDHFQLRRTAFNQAVVSLIKTIEGPQEIELELVMKLYRGSILGGTALAKINVFVSAYEF